MTAELQAFIDRVIVPALVEKFIAETAKIERQEVMADEGVECRNVEGNQGSESGIVSARQMHKTAK